MTPNPKQEKLVELRRHLEILDGQYGQAGLRAAEGPSSSGEIQSSRGEMQSPWPGPAGAPPPETDAQGVGNTGLAAPGVTGAPGAAGPSSLAPAVAETAPKDGAEASRLTTAFAEHFDGPHARAAATAAAKAANQGRARVLAAAAEREGRSDVPRDDWMAAFQGDQGRDSKQAQLQTELQEATDAVNASAWQQMR